MSPRRISSVLTGLLVVGSSLGLGSCGGSGSSGARPEILELDLRTALDADGDLPQLEDPVSPEETAAIADSFNWSDTEALPELDDAGRPALYYALVYITDYDQEALLDAMGVVHNSLPFFEEERARWDGQVGEFAFEGDGHGVFVFAIMAGELYNALRDVALAGEPVFE
ncbi:MAG: hypothetical protein GXP55_20580, partial [Deltaproteobacteria bacterium]|nr:hypothetical protein [Deltaproteobacteria bacterium]